MDGLLWFKGLNDSEDPSAVTCMAVKFSFPKVS